MKIVWVVAIGVGSLLTGTAIGVIAMRKNCKLVEKQVNELQERLMDMATAENK